MAKPPIKPDMLDWTIDEKLDLGEPEAPAASPASRRPNWRWLALGGLTIVVALMPWLYLRGGQGRAEQALRDQIALEVRPAKLPAPLPGFSLRADDRPRLAALTPLEGELYRADVAHRFQGPDGQVATFALPRFYKRLGEAWELQPTPPADFPGATQIYSGTRLTMQYAAADAGLLTSTLAPYLENLLARACAVTLCPAEYQLALDFVNVPARQPEHLITPLTAGAPWFFTWVEVARQPAASGQIIRRLDAPHRAGLPLDEPAVQEWERRLGLEALTALVLDSHGQSGAQAEPFLVALGARLAAHLELEPATVLTYTQTNPVRLKYFLQNPEPEFSVTAAEDALTVLNKLLNDQPPAAEAALWRRLAAQKGLTGLPFSAWLTAGLNEAGMSAETFYARVRAASGSSEPAAGSALSDADLALTCSPILMVYGRHGLWPVPNLEYLPGYTWQMEWSPDGRRLAVSAYFQTTVVEAPAGRLAWPPADPDPALVPLLGRWLSDHTLAYNEFPAAIFGEDRQALLPQTKLRFWDLTTGQVRAGPDGVLLVPETALVAPDRQTLAVIQPGPEGALTPGPLSVLPVTGGPLIPVAPEALQIAWAASGQALAFLQRTAAGGIAVNVWRLADHTLIPLWEWDSVDAQTQFKLAWSPEGSWLAVAAWHPTQNTGWTALIPAGGGPAQFPPELQGPARQAAFSADGDWLAVVLSGAQANTLKIYALATRSVFSQLDGRWWDRPIWSPRGAQLLAFAGDQPYLLSAPGADPAPLGDLHCSGGAWRP